MIDNYNIKINFLKEIISNQDLYSGAIEKILNILINNGDYETIENLEYNKNNKHDLNNYLKSIRNFNYQDIVEFQKKNILI